MKNDCCGSPSHKVIKPITGNYFCPMHLDVSQNEPGLCPQCGMVLEKVSSKATIYTCPMHPEVRQNNPGLCPICGMALEPLLFKTDEDSEYKSMLKRLIIALLLTLPVFFLGMSHFLPLDFIPQKLSSVIQFIFSTPVVLWCGWPFFERGWLSFKNRSLNMFTLISIGIGTAYLYSLGALLFSDYFPEAFKFENVVFVYFEAAAVITTFVLLGQVLELKAKKRTNEAISLLLQQSPTTAHRLKSDYTEEEVIVSSIQKNDRLRVKPGEKIPIDGEILEGSSYIDVSMMTGEPIPKAYHPGHSVIGGTINLQGSFVMKATKIGEETFLARLISFVSNAQRTKAPIQKTADQVASFFVPFVLIIALATFLIWYYFGPEPQFIYGLVNAVSVLIIACPCALGLATPMSLNVGMGKAAQSGILIKNAEALEVMEKTKILVLDKTGTLTKGQPEVVKIYSFSPDRTSHELLKMIASVEQSSEHPLAKAIVTKAKELNLLPFQSSANFQSFTGKGLVASIEGQKVIIGKLEFLKEHAVILPANMETILQKETDDEQILIFASVDQKLAGFLCLADPIKATTAQVISKLQKAGLETILLTGDRESTAKSISQKLGIKKFFSNILPENKGKLIQELKEKEKTVIAMAGDGINDAPALATADVGIAMGTGTDIAIEAAEITLLNGDLSGIIKTYQLSQATMKNIKQNLFFAFIYNFLGIPIAAGLLYPLWGVLLNPMIASLAMALSSFSVIMNALRLKKLKLH